MHLIKRIPLLIGLAASLFMVTAFAQVEGGIAERIAPVGDVYLDGEIATAGSATGSSEPADPRSGEKVYNTYCVACHGTGAAGAPIKGKTEDWATRISQGEAVLIKHAIEGFNAMPANGTCGDCSDDEMTATVQFLIEGL
ncbi:MAG: cytochrome c5 family protein [Psychromonas sp.]|nr:cytochrome c5 family protein [Alteromonadales bacterium]MCP5077592.1 cytochrome c5 family protein [Psychromonas sp.]